MPSFHFTQRIGHAGKGASHAAYILRTGSYAAGAARGKTLEDFEEGGSGKIPAWAIGNPEFFWLEADRREVATGKACRPLLVDGRPERDDEGKVIRVLQKNRGQVYLEIEVALPRELNKAQRKRLVLEYIDLEIGDRHAYTWAIHLTSAAIEGGPQPHLHLMFSERLIDGIARDPGQYFCRFRPKNPSLGGCKKTNSGKKIEAIKAELLQRRERWATLQNAHLAQAGCDDRVDHRSNEARGIRRAPEVHLGPKAFDEERIALRHQRKVRAELLGNQASLNTDQMAADIEVPLVVVRRRASERAQAWWAEADETLKSVVDSHSLPALAQDPEIEPAGLVEEDETEIDRPEFAQEEEFDAEGDSDIDSGGGMEFDPDDESPNESDTH